MSLTFCVWLILQQFCHNVYLLNCIMLIFGPAHLTESFFLARLMVAQHFQGLTFTLLPSFDK